MVAAMSALSGTGVVVCDLGFVIEQLSNLPYQLDGERVKVVWQYTREVRGDTEFAQVSGGSIRWQRTCKVPNIPLHRNGQKVPPDEKRFITFSFIQKGREGEPIKLGSVKFNPTFTDQNRHRASLKFGFKSVPEADKLKLSLHLQTRISGTGKDTDSSSFTSNPGDTTMGRDPLSSLTSRTAPRPGAGGPGPGPGGFDTFGGSTVGSVASNGSGSMSRTNSSMPPVTTASGQTADGIGAIEGHVATLCTKITSQEAKLASNTREMRNLKAAHAALQARYAELEATKEGQDCQITRMQQDLRGERKLRRQVEAMKEQIEEMEDRELEMQNRRGCSEDCSIM